jgi:hypothetical protein
MSEGFELIKEKIEEIIIDSVALKESMDELSEWDSIEEIMANFGAVQKFAQNVVLVVEIAAAEITSTLKNEEKLLAATNTIDNLIKLPWYLELVDGPIIHTFLKGAVYYLNKTFGQDWDLVAALDSVKSGRDFFELMLEKKAEK